MEPSWEPVKLTDVHGQVTDRWEEDFDVRASDEFRVHSSSILEQSPSEKTLGTVKLIKTKTKIRKHRQARNNVIQERLTFQSALQHQGDTRQVRPQLY